MCREAFSLEPLSRSHIGAGDYPLDTSTAIFVWSGPYRTFTFGITGSYRYRVRTLLRKKRGPTLETPSQTGRSQGLEKRIPTTYNIDKEHKLVLTTGFGFVTKEEVLILQDQMSNDPELDPTFSQIVDFAQLTGTDIGLADVHIFAQRDAFSTESRRAIVVKGDVAFGFAKIFELCRQLSGAHGIRVFRDGDEAFDWILSPEAVSTTG